MLFVGEKVNTDIKNFSLCSSPDESPHDGNGGSGDQEPRAKGRVQLQLQLPATE